MKKYLWLILLLLPCEAFAQFPGGTATNPVGANLAVQDAGTCSTSGSFLWQKLPVNAGTTTVNLAGTFSATVTVRESNNGGGTWTTAGTQNAVGTSTYTTNGFTDICADVTTYVSGTVAVTISTGLQQVQSTITIPGAGAPASVTVINVTGPPYNALSGRVCADVSTTINSPTITSATCNFTAADTNSIAWVNVHPPSSGQNLIYCGTTLTTATFVNSTTLTLSTNCNTTGTNNTLYLGPDSSTNISAACAALVAAGGGTVYAPHGNYLLGTGVSPNPTCNITSGASTSALIGDGEGSTFFYTAPWYNHTFNFGSVFALTAANRNYASGWTLEGQGAPVNPGVADTVVDMSVPAVDHITIAGYAFQGGNNECLYINGLGGSTIPAYISNSTITRCRQTAFAISTTSVMTLENDSFDSNTNAIEWSSAAGNSHLTILGGTYQTFGWYNAAGNQAANALLLPQSGTPPGITVTIVGASICNGISGTAAILQNISTAIMKLVAVRINDAGDGSCITTGTNSTGITNTAGTVYLQNTHLFATGTGSSINNSGTVSDLCGNALSGGAGNYTGAGSLVNCAAEPSVGGRCLITSGAGPLACGASANGKVAVPVSLATYTINTVAVQSGSIITLTPTTDNTGIPGAPACAAPGATPPFVSATVAGTSFTITQTNAASIFCYS